MARQDAAATAPTAPFQRRRGYFPLYHRVLWLVALLAPSFGASAVLNTTSLASECARNLELSVGNASCSAACGVGYSAACIAFSSGASPCDSTAVNASAVVAATCPLPVSGDCAYQCLDWADATSDSFTFFVTPSASASVSTPQGALRQSERYVSSVGAFAMPDRVRYVSIIGGSSVDNLTDSSPVVSVRVALQLSGVGVTNLTLANLNMAPTGVPSIGINQSTPSLQSLRIVNSQLTSLPVDASSLAALTTLDLSRNRVVTFPEERSLESLLHLSLRNNSLTSFQATFPALQTLDLSMNALTAIPDNVILFTKLKSLNISGNPIASAQITPAQYSFLVNVSSLTFDPFPATDCTEANQRLLKTAVVCVIDSKKMLVVNKSSLAWYIGVPVVGTAAITVGAFSLWYYRRKKKNAKLQAAGATGRSTEPMATKTESTGEGHTHNDDDGGHVVDYIRLGGAKATSSSNDSDAAVLIQLGRASAATSQAPGSHSLWTDEDLLACQLRYEDIEDVKQIGSGAYGVVWLVNYRQARLLASKRLIKDQITRQKTQAFVAEIKLNIQLTHPSIVHFVGVAWTVETDLQALFEYMANGDLRAYLDARRYDAEATSRLASKSGWSQEKLQIAIDVVEALVYVHSFTPPLVHRDLKSRNVLLAEDMKAKLSDFGVSRFQSENDTMTAGVGTGRWLAPEVLAGESDYDHTSDIYSFGVVLSELDTHTLPYEELQCVDVAILQMVVTGAVRPHFRDDCPHAIRGMAVSCLAFDRSERPSAMEIAFRLRTLAKDDLRSVTAL